MLYQVRAPHFTAGVLTDDRTNTIVEAAPILGWAVGKQASELASWVISKRGTMIQVRGHDLENRGYIPIGKEPTPMKGPAQEDK